MQEKLGKTDSKRLLERTKLYAKAWAEVTKINHVDHVSIFDHMTKENWVDPLDDGLHFSEVESKFLHSLVMPWIKERTNHTDSDIPKQPRA